MKRQPISFHDLLARVLPLSALAPADRARVERALAGGQQAALEQAALVALDRLREAGVLDWLPDRVEGPDRVLRFQRRDSHEIFALRFAAPALPAGLEAQPRALVTLRGAPSAERVRRLARLDAALIHEDGRLPSGPAELIGQLVALGRELLDADGAAFFPATALAEATGAYAPPPGEVETLAPWSRDAVLARDFVLVCPDVLAAPAVRDRPPAAGTRSAAAVRVRAGRSGIAGVLEARSARPGHFTPERLALLALLAERFSALADQAERLERLVFVDALTGAFNGVYFRQALANEVARARRESHPMALVIADIDDFKRFNTVYGYEGGNEVLRQVARALKRTVRPFDSVARWGGEEFAVLLTSPVEREDARTIAERLRQAVAESEHRITGLDGEEHVVHVTVSLGGALFPADATSAEDLWRRANQALLKAKEPPKGRVVFFGEGPGTAPPAP